MQEAFGVISHGSADDFKDLFEASVGNTAKERGRQDRMYM